MYTSQSQLYPITITYLDESFRWCNPGSGGTLFLLQLLHSVLQVVDLFLKSLNLNLSLTKLNKHNNYKFNIFSAAEGLIGSVTDKFKQPCQSVYDWMCSEAGFWFSS